MISKKQIQDNLSQMDNLYRKSIGPMQPLFYSKLAILELCGWIEESMDDIVQKCAKRYLKEGHNINFVNSSVIRQTHGFGYKNNFRNMLMQVIGIINTERLEHNLDSTNFDILKSTLGSLKECRDLQAHTYVKGTTPHIDAPSTTQGHFQKIYVGLEDIEARIRKMKL